MKIKYLLKKILFRSNQRPMAGCQNESSRNEWVKEKLKILPSGSRILDAGAGEKPFKKYCSHLEYISQDFGQYNPVEVKTGLQMTNWDYGNLDLISDIATIPVPEKSFDAILCTEVFEHVINPIEAVKEFARILKKNGSLIITAPFCSLTHFAPYHFYSGFNQYFYKKVLEKEGFEITEIVPNGNYFEFLAQEVGRLPGVAEKYSKKNLTTSEIKNLSNLKILLQKLSDEDSSSSELLCFGYFVLARKKW